MHAFDLAHAAGVAGFETDLRLSSDGKLICCHDDNLASFDRPDITISQMMVTDLERVEIFSPDRKLSGNILRLKTLLKKYPDKRYIFDCKVDDEGLFVKLKSLLEDLKFHDNIWFLTWSEQADKYVREYFPGYKYFPHEDRLTVWGLASMFGLGRLFEPRHEILSLPAFHNGRPVFSKKQVNSLSRRGKIFMGYLVNTYKDYARFRECDGGIILTDLPSKVSEWEQRWQTK